MIAIVSSKLADKKLMPFILLVILILPVWAEDSGAPPEIVNYSKDWPLPNKDYPNGSSRPGPNLYTNSMLALNHSTGNLLWYTQVYPHDTSGKQWLAFIRTISWPLCLKERREFIQEAKVEWKQTWHLQKESSMCL